MITTEERSEWGKQGGAATKEKYGSDYYREIGRKGGTTAAQRQDMAALGKKGGAARGANKEAMAEIGRKGAAERWRRWREEQGRSSEDTSADV